MTRQKHGKIYEGAWYVGMVGVGSGQVLAGREPLRVNAKPILSRAIDDRGKRGYAYGYSFGEAFGPFILKRKAASYLRLLERTATSNLGSVPLWMERLDKRDAEEGIGRIKFPEPTWRRSSPERKDAEK